MRSMSLIANISRRWLNTIQSHQICDFNIVYIFYLSAFFQTWLPRTAMQWRTLVWSERKVPMLQSNLPFIFSVPRDTYSIQPNIGIPNSKNYHLYEWPKHWSLLKWPNKSEILFFNLTKTCVPAATPSLLHSNAENIYDLFMIRILIRRRRRQIDMVIALLLFCRCSTSTHRMGNAKRTDEFRKSGSVSWGKLA